MAQDGFADTVFAKINADFYAEFTAKFDIKGFPGLRIFARNQEPGLGEEVAVERTRESVLQYLVEKLAEIDYAELQEKRARGEAEL